LRSDSGAYPGDAKVPDDTSAQYLKKNQIVIAAGIGGLVAAAGMLELLHEFLGSASSERHQTY